MKERTDNGLIDLIKFIGSIMIFAMHIRAFSDNETVGFAWELCTRWAVPFFFTASAYFFYSKESGPEAVKKYAKRIGMLYLCWLVFNLPSMINSFLQNDLAKLDTWIRFLGNCLLSSSFKGSWYLTSSIFCVGLIFVLGKKLTTGQMLWLSVPVQLLSVLNSTYYGLMPGWLRVLMGLTGFPNNLLSGLIYVVIGKYIAENRARISSMKRSTCLAAFAACYVLFFAEILLTKKWGWYRMSDQAFALVPMGFFGLTFCLNSATAIPKSRLLRKASTIIYCGQGNVIQLAIYLGKRLYGETASCLTVAAIGALLMAALIAAVLRIQSWKKWNWTKYLT